MSTISVKEFLGIAPKIGASLLQQSQAQVARNAKLWSHQLRPFDGLGGDTALAKTTGDLQTIYFFNNATWFSWTQDVDVVRGAISIDGLEKTYFTGTDTPRVTTNDIYNLGTTGTNRPPDSFILGIPAPVGPPVASLNGAGAVTATSTWVYTFVRKYSDGTVEESAPSVPSNALTMAAQQANVTMPNGALTVANYGITHKRLYRNDGSGYFFVSESTVATSPASDNIASQNLGSALTTQAYLPPPDGMTGLIMLPSGVAAGFYRNTVYLSEPYRPHTYPAINQYTVNYPIVALGSVGTSIIVATTGVPFIGRGVDPAQYSFKPTPAKLPCVSKRSMKSSEFGAFYASTGGMVGFDGANVTLVTREFITRDEWQANFAPTTIHGAVYDGRYYGWFQTGTDANGTKVGGGFVLDKSEAAFLINLDEYVYAAHAIPVNDELWVQKKNPFNGLLNYVFHWEANPGSPRTYEWKSKEFITPGAENFAFAQIIADFGQTLTQHQIAAIQAQIAVVQAANNALANTSGPINGNAAGFEIDGGPMGGDNETQVAPSLAGIKVISFTYWADGVMKLQRDVYNTDPFPLPSGFTALRHEFSVSGNTDISEVALATSQEELATV